MAIVLTVAPFVVLALVYATVFAPVWQIDLVQMEVLASRLDCSSASAMALIYRGNATASLRRCMDESPAWW